jgi:hypothetical protein
MEKTNRKETNMTSKNFERLTELVDLTSACGILNELIAEEYERQNPDADFEQRNLEWDAFCDRYTGAAADLLITNEVLAEYE